MGYDADVLRRRTLASAANHARRSFARSESERRLEAAVFLTGEARVGVPHGDVQRLAAAVGNGHVARVVARNGEDRPVERDDPLQTKESTVVVADDVEALTPGQMRRSAFLERLREELYRAGTEEYRGTPYTVDGCPYVAAWFAKYASQGAAVIEHAVRAYARGETAVTAGQLIDGACERARNGFCEQARSGAITQIPDELPGPGVAAPSAIARTMEQVGGRLLQRGCVKGQAGSGAVATAPVAVVRDVQMDDCVTVGDGHTTLKTGGFAGCWGIILIGADGARTMAHISPLYQLPRLDPGLRGYTTPAGWPHIDHFTQRARTARHVYIYQHGVAFHPDHPDTAQLLQLLAVDPAKVQLMGKVEPIFAYPDGSVSPKAS